MIFGAQPPYFKNEIHEIPELIEEFHQGIKEIHAEHREIVSDLENFIERQMAGEISDYGQEEMLIEWEAMYRSEMLERQQLETQEMYEEQKQQIIDNDFRLY